MGVTVCLCVHIYVCWWAGGGIKVINIQWPGEGEERGQRGTKDGILPLCVPHCLSLSQHDISVHSFNLSLFFSFSLNCFHIWFGPPLASCNGS